jgi:hypothetical protein
MFDGGPMPHHGMTIQTSEAGFICTLGFAATNVNFLAGFVTASHCTAT